MAVARNLMEAIRYVDPDVCVDFVARLRWPDGPTCPRCSCTDYSFLTTRNLWKCKRCKAQYSVKAGSIFEDSPIALGTWLTAIWLIANSKNGMSSHELGRSIGLTQKSAWFVQYRVRLATQTGSFDRVESNANNEYDRFADLARRLARVPKKELDQARRRAKLAKG